MRPLSALLTSIALSSTGCASVARPMRPTARGDLIVGGAMSAPGIFGAREASAFARLGVFPNVDVTAEARYTIDDRSSPRADGGYGTWGVGLSARLHPGVSEPREDGWVVELDVPITFADYADGGSGARVHHLPRYDTEAYREYGATIGAHTGSSDDRV